MGSLIDVYPDRANNEIMAAVSLKRLSEQEKDRVSFDLPDDVPNERAIVKKPQLLWNKFGNALRKGEGLKNTGYSKKKCFFQMRMYVSFL